MFWHLFSVPLKNADPWLSSQILKRHTENRTGSSVWCSLLSGGFTQSGDQGPAGFFQCGLWFFFLQRLFPARSRRWGRKLWVTDPWLALWERDVPASWRLPSPMRTWWNSRLPLRAGVESRAVQTVAAELVCFSLALYLAACRLELPLLGYTTLSCALVNNLKHTATFSPSFFVFCTWILSFLRDFRKKGNWIHVVNMQF